MRHASTSNGPKWQRMNIYKLCVVCSFCCVASVVKSVVSVSFFTGFHLNNTLFHSRFVIEQSDGSGSGGCTDFHAHKHHKHKVYQHMYSYIRKNKWHYKTCLALAAGTTFQTQTVQASGTFVDYHAVLFSYSLVRLNWFAISLDGTYAKTK